jgi:fumarate hydratase class II
MPTRTEHDAMGAVEVPADRFWGAQTQRSLEHFRIGHERWPRTLLRALGIVKRSAAVVNARLGLLTPEMRDAIVDAADRVIAGELDEHFPLVIWQTGSGTQTNMNANEVIAFLATQSLGQEVHPNDHVNRSQSSNDVIPTAMHIAAVEDLRLKLLPAVLALRNRIDGKSLEFKAVVKLGRTHGMDAVPMTVGQELSAWVSQLDHGMQALRNGLAHVQELAIGGTAVGTGLNAPAKFGDDVAWEIAQYTQIRFVPAQNRFEALASHDALGELHGGVKRLAVSLLKIANDIRILAGGPRGGLAELILPSNEPGSSIMPGKVNPTQAEALAMVAMRVIGNDVTLGLANSQGALQLNVCKPLIIHTVLESIGLLTDACASFDTHCIAGLRVNNLAIAQHLERSLMLVTALTPQIGYERAAELAKLAQAQNLTIRQAALQMGVLDAATLDALLVPERMIAPQTER